MQSLSEPDGTVCTQTFSLSPDCPQSHQREVFPEYNPPPPLPPPKSLCSQSEARGLSVSLLQTRSDWFESSGAHQVSLLLSTCFGCHMQTLCGMLRYNACFNVCGCSYWCLIMSCSAHQGRCWRCTLTLDCLSDSSQTGGLAPGSASS